MKKKIIILITLITALLILWKIYSVYIEYTISDNTIEIKQGIEKLMQRSKESNKNFDIDILETIHLDNKIYAAFTIQGKIGNAELAKGINNKYKVSTLKYGDSPYICEIYETNKGKYIVVTSKNYDLKTYYAKVTLLEFDNPIYYLTQKSKDYILKIPQKDTYLSYKKIPNKLSNSHFLEIRLLNKEKQDITSEILELHRKYRK